LSIKYAILGFLSWQPLTGYDLKKRFAESEALYWSGNSNQIYRALIELHQEKLVTQEIQDQESGPSRKVYAITDKGLSALREWVLSTPELPQIRNSFLAQLAWADQLDAGELDVLLAAYEDEVHVKQMMLREQAQRNNISPARTPREAYLWAMITKNLLTFYEHEWDWVRQMRHEVSSL
jgi:PadR family transcriptional regulator AphA